MGQRYLVVLHRLLRSSLSTSQLFPSTSSQNLLELFNSTLVDSLSQYPDLPSPSPSQNFTLLYPAFLLIVLSPLSFDPAPTVCSCRLLLFSLCFPTSVFVSFSILSLISLDSVAVLFPHLSVPPCFPSLRGFLLCRLSPFPYLCKLPNLHSSS